MDLSEKGREVAEVVRAELRNALFLAAPGAKKAIEALAGLVEEIAHEVEILKIRADRQAGMLPKPDKSDFINKGERHEI